MAPIYHIMRDFENPTALCGRVRKSNIHSTYIQRYVDEPPPHRYIYNIRFSLAFNDSLCEECTSHEDYPLIVLGAI